MPRPPAPDPTAMSDDELRQRCAPRPSETRLERVGCGASSLISIAVAVGAVVLSRPIVGDLAIVLGGLAFVAALIGLLALTFHLAGARSRALGRCGPHPGRRVPPRRGRVIAAVGDQRLASASAGALKFAASTAARRPTNRG